MIMGSKKKKLKRTAGKVGAKPSKRANTVGGVVIGSGLVRVPTTASTKVDLDEEVNSIYETIPFSSMHHDEFVLNDTFSMYGLFSFCKDVDNGKEFPEGLMADGTDAGSYWMCMFSNLDFKNSAVVQNELLSGDFSRKECLKGDEELPSSLKELDAVPDQSIPKFSSSLMRDDFDKFKEGQIEMACLDFPAFARSACVIPLVIEERRKLKEISDQDLEEEKLLDEWKEKSLALEDEEKKFKEKLVARDEKLALASGTGKKLLKQNKKLKAEGDTFKAETLELMSTKINAFVKHCHSMALKNAKVESDHPTWSMYVPLVGHASVSSTASDVLKTSNIEQAHQ